MNRITHVLLFSLCLMAAGCTKWVAPPIHWQQAAHIPQPERATGAAMVVSDSGTASEAAANVMRQGGNAADAAVTAAFMLAVTWPEAGNIGGGGFMMVHDPRGGKQSVPIMFDFRETAPGAATQDMYQLGESVHTAKAVGTPGTVRGLALVHEQHGSKPWSELVMPAVLAAEQGITVSQGLADSLNGVLSRLDDDASFDEFRRVYARPGGGKWVAGDTLKQPDLAVTLRIIARNGPDAFYQGPIADLIVAEMKRGNGIISSSDLADYQAKQRKPIHFQIQRSDPTPTPRNSGFDVYAPNLPSSGGYTLRWMFHLMEHRLGIEDQQRWSVETLHDYIESSKNAFAARAMYLGDSDFNDLSDVPSPQQFAKAATYDATRATPSADIATAPKVVNDEGESTTHFSVVDANGMAVSCTYTLEQSYGSRIVVRHGGFLLNNEMGDFNWKAGHTDRRGRIGTKPNLIEPGKRMLSSMTPVIVLKDGEVFMVTGSPGGRTIINTVGQMLLNIIVYDMPPADAVQSPRLHHQWMPDVVSFEAVDDPAFADVVAQLRAMGHDFREGNHVRGSAHTIVWDKGLKRFVGIADRRRDGEGGAVGH